MITQTSLKVLRWLIMLGHSIGFIPLQYSSPIQCKPCNCPAHRTRGRAWKLIVFLSTLLTLLEIYHIISHRNFMTTWHLISAAFHGFFCFMNFATILNSCTFKINNSEVCVFINWMLKFGRQRKNCKKQITPIFNSLTINLGSNIYFVSRETCSKELYCSSKTSQECPPYIPVSMGTRESRLGHCNSSSGTGVSLYTRFFG